jgi:hypothetical protein
MGWSNEDDGEFFIPIEAYMKEFCALSICVPTDPSVYRHSSFIHDFTTVPKMEFFTFTLTEGLDLAKNSFSISVCQQGSRIKNYRLKKDEFSVSTFRILLMKSDGEIVKGTFGGHERFMFSLVCQ